MQHRRRRASLLGGLVLLLAWGGACAPRRLAFEVPPAPTPLATRSTPQATGLPSSGGPLTVERAVDLALDRNPDMGLAEARIRGAQAALSGACAQRNPYIAGDVTVLAADAPSYYLMKRIDARTFQPGTDFNDPGAFANLEVGATLRQNIWDWGRTRLGVWSAEAGVDRARAGRDAVTNQLVAGVIATFLQARAAEELLAADDASVKTVESQVNETRVKVEQGGALRSDQLSLEVRLAEARERRLRTDLARRSALAGLKQLLALPPNADLVLAPAVAMSDGLPPNRETALVEAYRSRSEVKAARLAVKQARIDVERARRGSMPSLDVQARWYGDDEGIDLSSNWWVAVALTFDIWDGGRTRANVAMARAVMEQIEEQDRKALLAIAHDVETAWLGIEEGRARLAVATQAVGAAEESLDLVEKQYRGGTATITRYLEAEGARTRARTSQIRASLDLNRAIVNARRATGRLGREASRRERSRRAACRGKAVR